ncbi:hypothetical protein [Nevskia sp.]|uniref:hypothetical protein n=1 Tax=Nevskia sp. TaxID=1929292 RepID=UPI0025D61399|nr:hypothetical protein [Nevskia sp.]
MLTRRQTDGRRCAQARSLGGRGGWPIEAMSKKDGRCAQGAKGKERTAKAKAFLETAGVDSFSAFLVPF